MPVASRKIGAGKRMPLKDAADAAKVSGVSGAVSIAALPVPAAIVRVEDGIATEIVATNALFAALDPSGDARAEAGASALLSSPPVLAALARLSDIEEPVIQFNWTDPDDQTGQVFRITLSMLDPVDDRPARNYLLTLLDREGKGDGLHPAQVEMMRDGMTGLPNRSAFIDALERAIEDNDTSRHAVLMIDLSRFGQVNESFGSVAGDELLVMVARRLVSTLRSGDMLARIGGDEFGILLDLPRGTDDAIHAARRIHAALLIPFRLSELEIRIDCAIGCALVGEAGMTAEETIRNAQFALKRAKTSQRVELFQAGDGFATRRRFSIETELRRALEAGHLSLAYQPLIDLQVDRVAGFEALARWEREDAEPISPTEFIPVAEESGLIVPLGRWAIHEAMRCLASWDRAAGRVLPIYVAVNISAVQLMRDDIPRLVRNALEDHGLHGSRIMLELTESAIIADPERATRMLRQLKELQTRIAMDDFGTGYSSLASLQKLPIDLLKIDRSFVTDMIANRDSVAIIRAILSLAGALGMNTTAEGVESGAVADMLPSLGCSYGQAYHFSTPLAAAQAYEFCASHGLLSETP